MTINEEFHRLVLRIRFVRWLTKNWQKITNPAALSARLTRFKPTYEERTRKPQ